MNYGQDIVKVIRKLLIADYYWHYWPYKYTERVLNMKLLGGIYDSYFNPERVYFHYSARWEFYTAFS